MEQFSTTDASSISDKLQDVINQELEQSFTAAACIAKEMNDVENSELAAKRVFSYKPNSEIILDLFPKYKPVINEITQLVNKYSKSLKEDPTNADSWELLANCYLILGDFPNAFAAYSHAMRILPENQDSNFLYAISIVYAHFRHHDHALMNFKKILENNPNFVFSNDIKFRTAILQRIVGNYDQSLKMFEEVKRSPPNGLLPEDITIQIAYTHQVSGNTDLAHQIYSDLHQRFPQSLKLTQQYCLFLYLLYKNTNIDRVKTDIDEALKAHPDDPILLMIAARIAMKQDDMSTAYNHYRYCTTYYSKSAYFWCGLGVLYYKNDQTPDAVIAFQRGLYLKSDMPEAWLNFGLIFEQIGNIPNAIKVYQIGMQKCEGCPQFAERLNAIEAQKNGHKKVGTTYELIDIDDSKFITPIPEQFASDYISAVPTLPPSCFKVDAESAEKFDILSTYPKSIFL